MATAEPVTSTTSVDCPSVILALAGSYVADLHRDCQHLGLEALGFNADFVLARDQRAGGVGTRRRTGELGGLSGGFVGDGDGRVGDNGAVWICDRALNASGGYGGLCACR